MSEPDDIPESDYECPGCGQQFGGPWSMDVHIQNCNKALLTVEPACRECGDSGCNGECGGDDMMGASG